MTHNVPLCDDIERVVLVTVDCLRWDYHDAYRELYPDGVWYRGTPQATYTPTSHTSTFTGRNPLRHGVYWWGDTYTGKDTIFTVTDSASASEMTRPENGITVHGLGVSDQYHIPFAPWFPEYLANSAGDSREHDGNREELRNVAKYEFAFLHDWILHTTGPGDDSSWGFKLNSDLSSENHEAYRRTQKMSLAAHSNLLNALANDGLYENTLFVVWGDHGQACGAPPFEHCGHGHEPEEEVARIPIGFCSPQFDSIRVDTDTNARGVDVLPTLKTLMRHAGLRFDDLSHRLEGVDLTEFEGKLGGYTMGSSKPPGTVDGIRTARYALICEKEETLLETYDRSRGDKHQIQNRRDEPRTAMELSKYHKRVREEPTKLIITQ